MIPIINKNLIYQKNNLIVSATAIILTIIFVSIDKFSYFAIIIGILNILFVYLYQFKNNSEFLSYSLTFIIYFILFYLWGSDLLNQYIAITLISLFTGIVTYVLCISKNTIGQTKIIYSILISLIICEISNISFSLNHTTAVMSLMLVLFFYLISGFFRIHQNNQFNFYSILKYSIIFGIGLTLLLLRVSYII